MVEVVAANVCNGQELLTLSDATAVKMELEMSDSDYSEPKVKVDHLSLSDYELRIEEDQNSAEDGMNQSDLSCKLCSMTFAKKATLKKHLKHIHGKTSEDAAEMLKDVRPDEIAKKVCPICNKQKTKMARHVKLCQKKQERMNLKKKTKRIDKAFIQTTLKKSSESGKLVYGDEIVPNNIEYLPKPMGKFKLRLALKKTTEEDDDEVDQVDHGDESQPKRRKGSRKSKKCTQTTLDKFKKSPKVRRRGQQVRSAEERLELVKKLVEEKPKIFKQTTLRGPVIIEHCDEEEEESEKVSVLNIFKHSMEDNVKLSKKTVQLYAEAMKGFVDYLEESRGISCGKTSAEDLIGILDDARVDFLNLKKKSSRKQFSAAYTVLEPELLKMFARKNGMSS